MVSIGPLMLTSPPPMTEHRSSLIPAHAGHLRALIVDDHPINTRVMTVLLQQMGLHCVCVGDGAAAVDAVAQGRVDVVFMDYHMPKVDGFEATARIRQLPAPLNHTPVVVVTADVCSNTQLGAHAVGADAFLAKPVRVHELKAALAQALKARVGSSAWVDDRQETGTITASGADAQTAPPPRTRLAMINPDIFQELRDIIPADQWQVMLDSLFAPSSGDVDQLLDVLHQGPRSAIGDQAHKIKGAAMLMGLTRLGEAAAELEHLARRSSDAIDAPAWCTRIAALAQDSHQAALTLLKA